MTQADLAMRVRREGLDYFSQITVSRIENRSRPARLGEAQAIARVFSLELNDLLVGDARYLAARRAIWAHGIVEQKVVELRGDLASLGATILNMREDLVLIDSLPAGPPDSHAEQMIAAVIDKLRQVASTDLRSIFEDVAGSEF